MKRTPPGAEERACRGCGKRVLWITAANGAQVPLDPVAPTYQLQIVNDAAEPTTARWVRANEEHTQEPALVSHFSTCSAANQFSGRNKR